MVFRYSLTNIIQKNFIEVSVHNIFSQKIYVKRGLVVNKTYVVRGGPFANNSEYSTRWCQIVDIERHSSVTCVR